MNRRTACKLLAGTSGTLLMAPGRSIFGSAMRNPVAGSRLYNHVLEYTRLGEHRTGTAGDLATSAWVREKFEAFGLEANLVPVKLNLFEVDSAFIEIDHVRFRADPEWFPTSTPSNGVTAPLRMLSEGEDVSVLRGHIWVTEVQMERPVIPKEVKERALDAARAGALGVVMVTRFRTDELTGRGAHGEAGHNKWIPIPLVAVAAKHKAIVSAAKRGVKARLVVTGTEQPNANAYNVTGTNTRVNTKAHTEKGNDAKYIIVTTPQSGMFRCGGERGGGIALLLGLAEWAGRRNGKTRYLFSTNTGHEQSGSGAHKLLEAVPHPDQVAAWLHLGSGMSSWHWRPRKDGTFERYTEKSGVRNFGASPSLLPLLSESFKPIPDLEPQSQRYAGELRHYIDAGYASFGFWGYNQFGHTLADGPEQVSPSLLEPVGECLVRALEVIERTI
ncbi:MAG: hypothetical protein WD002_00730 [Pseudomonadales bacterium]